MGLKTPSKEGFIQMSSRFLPTANFNNHKSRSRQATARKYRLLIGQEPLCVFVPGSHDWTVLVASSHLMITCHHYKLVYSRAAFQHFLGHGRHQQPQQGKLSCQPIRRPHNFLLAGAAPKTCWKIIQMSLYDESMCLAQWIFDGFSSTTLAKSPAK